MDGHVPWQCVLGLVVNQGAAGDGVLPLLDQVAPHGAGRDGLGDFDEGGWRPAHLYLRLDETVPVCRCTAGLGWCPSY